MQQLLETVRIKVNFIHISVLNYLFVLKNVRHFIPNCWLRNEIAEQEQIFALNETNFFFFGGGNQKCIERIIKVLFIHQLMHEWVVF